MEDSMDKPACWIKSMPLNRREAKMGFGDEIPQAGLRAAALSFPPVTPIKKQESGSEAKPDSANPALNRYPVTPALGRAPQGG